VKNYGCANSIRFHLDRKCRPGVTLVEVTVATLLVGLMVIISLRSVGRAVASSLSVREQKLAELLAEDILVEVLQSHYSEPGADDSFGREAGETLNSRSNWDDVDDYSAWREAPPVSRGGRSLPGTDGWTRKSEVSFAAVDRPDQVIDEDEGLKLITVTVVSPEGRVLQRQRLRSRWGALEQTTPLPITWVTIADIQLSDTRGNSAAGTVGLVNAVEDVNDD
jgi:hypothetical protein